MIEPDALVELATRLLPVADGMAETEYGGATKFELETAMGLAYWERMGCEWVALETGLGGRLDATNVVTPRACAITSIGLDHTAILGTCVEEIAREKAGIIKPGVPVVLGELPAAAEAEIVRIAHERGAPVWRRGREYSSRAVGSGFEVVTPVGRYPAETPRLGGLPAPNAELAIAACAAAGALPPSADLSQGVGRAWLPGRWDWRTIGGRRVLFDGAHNADAARLLASRLEGKWLRLVSNMISGHEVAPFYRAFGPLVAGVEVAPIASPRALPTEEAVRQIEALGLPARAHRSVYKAVRAALEEEETVVVTGSNYLVGAALRIFGG